MRFPLGHLDFISLALITAQSAHVYFMVSRGQIVSVQCYSATAIAGLTTSHDPPCFIEYTPFVFSDRHQISAPEQL